MTDANWTMPLPGRTKSRRGTRDIAQNRQKWYVPAPARNGNPAALLHGGCAMFRMGWVVGVVTLIAYAALVAADSPRKLARDGAPASDRLIAEVTPAAVEKKLKQVEGATNLDEPVRKNLVEKYSAALEHLKTAEQHKSAAKEFRKKTEEAPQELERLKAELTDAPGETPPAEAQNLGLAELQEALSRAEERYEELQKQLEQSENEPNRRADRQSEIPELLESIRNQLEEIEKQPAAAAPAGAAFDPQAVAERVLLTARRRALEHELAVYEEELRHYELTVDLIEARRDHDVVLTERAEQHLKAWRAALNDRRQKDADRQAEEARETARHAHPAIRCLAEENAALTAQRQELVDRMEIATKSEEALQEQIEALKGIYERVSERVERVGLTESIGVVLRKQRESIP